MKKLLLTICLLLCSVVAAQATEITVGSSQWFAGSYRYAGTTATLRIYYSQSMLTSTNVSVVGSAVGSNGWFKSVACTVSSATLTCASFTFHSTVDSNKTNNRFFAVLYDQAGARRETLMGDASGWIVPASPTTTTVALLLNAQGTGIPNPPVSYLNASQVQTLISTAVGTLNDATETVKGRTKLSVAAASASNPIAAGTNDGRFDKLESDGDVVTTGALTVGADSDASGTDAISLQTRGTTRLSVNNDGTLTASGIKLTLGNTATAAGARIDFTTKPTNTATAGRLFNWWSQTFALADGPGGEPNYDDDEQQRSYNRSTSGAKTVAGIKDFGWVDEARFYQGGFQSEHYFEYTNPGNTVTFRPWALLIGETNSDATHGLIGKQQFFRNPPNQATQWGEWSEAGALDLSYTSAASVTFKNNVSALLWKNAANNNTVPAIYVNGSDKIVVGTGSNIILGGSTSVGTLTDVSTISGINDSNTTIVFAGGDVLRLSVGGSKVLDLNEFITWFASKPVGFEVDNTYDFGFFNSTNYRPRDIYAGRDIYAANQFKSTIATGTAPLVVASTTNVANLNASSLSGATFAAPGAIGGGTPAAITGTTVVANSTLAVTGVTTPTGGIAAAGGFSISPRLIASCGTPAITTTQGTDTTPVNTETYIVEVFIPANSTVTGVALLNGSAAAGNVKISLATSAGVPIAGAVTASTAQAGTAAYQLIPFAVAYAAKGPATYYVLIQFDTNTTPRFRTHTFAGVCGASKKTGETYGTFTTVTAPSTFTASLGPVVSLY